MFLTPVRMLVAQWADHFPRAAQRWPYDVMLKMAEMRVRQVCPQAAVWPRNSLALGHWIFAVSDLDLSIWVEGNALEANRAWNAVKAGARWNLLGGEIHIFSSEAVRVFLPFANPWELKRDPLLLERTGFQLQSSNPAQTLVYFVRQLIADHALFQNPAARRGKWQRFFTAVDEPMPEPFTVHSLAQRLVANEVFANYTAEEILMALTRRELSPRLKRLLYPNQHVWCDQEEELDRQFLKELGPAGHDYLEAMVEWEIWGLSPFTLVTSGFSLKSLRGHWINEGGLVNMLALSEERKSRLLMGMSALARYYETLETDG